MSVLKQQIMVRRVFFSFHYERDHWRTNTVRNSWVTQEDREAAGFIDAAEWEAIKRSGDDAIEQWIDNQLNGTSVTAVLIGHETSNRKWVNREIEKSYERGNGIVGIRIHRLKDKDGNRDLKGKNPLEDWYVKKNGRRKYFSEIFNTYDWKRDNGYENIGNWVEEAAQIAGR